METETPASLSSAVETLIDTKMAALFNRMSSVAQKQILTTVEAAAYLSVTPGHMKKWRASGKGPQFFKLTDSDNSPIRYRLEDLETFVAERLKGEQEEAE